MVGASPVCEDPVDVVSDLAFRWARARRAALRSCVPDADPAASELDLIACAIAIDAAAAQKAIFTNSLLLGRSFCRFAGKTLSLDELPAVLAGAQTTCCS